MAHSNSIALAYNYLPILDEVYKRASLTLPLEAGNERVRFINAHTIELFKTSINGLGNYSRNAGFVDGDITATWEPLALTKDRGRSFLIDAMDDEETVGMAFGTLVGEFIRCRVVPEIDAYRFATIAAATGIQTATAADITVGTTDVPGLVDVGEQALDEEEVPVEGRLLYISELAYAGLKAKITRYLANESGVNKEVEMYNGMRVIRVPQKRFGTGITLNDGSTSGQTDGGYYFTASTSKPINFMIIHPSAVAAVMKHVRPRIFAPDINQGADGWKFDYRVYHDIFVLDNKVKGVYLHAASTGFSAKVSG